MYKVKRPCRVCGKMFVPCSDCENDKNAFHWRSVACSPECAREYFRRVIENRAKENIKENTEIKRNDITKIKKRTRKLTKQKINEESE